MVHETDLGQGFSESTTVLVLGRRWLYLTWTHGQSSDHHGVARELLSWL